MRSVASRIVVFAAAACVVGVGVEPSHAGEPCVGIASNNNPAFGTPRPCGAAKAETGAASAKRAPTSSRAADEVTKTDRGTVYRYGDTTIAVGGHVTLDIGTGRTGSRP